MTAPTVLAAAAHPDDIEFMMAGTLLLLKDAGCHIHIWNLADGRCGTDTLPPEKITTIRWQETQHSARLAGATAHPPLFPDIAIFYDACSLAKVAAVLRTIRPHIILTHCPTDYMEDHQNCARLITTAAFTRSMPNFPTDPPVPTWHGHVALYHAMPHGLRDALRRPVRPHFTIDISSVLERKKQMLACHTSQKDWLDKTQGMDAYLHDMENMARTLAAATGHFTHAEGWLRHNHLGFAPEDCHPIQQLIPKEKYAQTTE
jgi:LmbE family N-acetylglucosaminyl deacetylase